MQQTDVWIRTDLADFDHYIHAEWPVTLERRDDGWHVIGGQADGEVWPTLSDAKRAVYRS